MRIIRDESGVEWSVYNVIRQVRPTGKRIESLLPAGFANGWLVFQSDTGKRRLAPYPPNWERLPEATLRSFLAAAVPARPSGEVVIATDRELARRDEEDDTNS